MAIISPNGVIEDFNQQTYDRGKEDLRIQRKFTVAFDGSDSITNEKILAASATGIPAFNSSHPDLAYLFVRQKTVNARSPHYYDVTVTYENIAPITGDNEVPIDPTLEKPDVSWSTVAISEKIDRGIDDKPITNSAGQTFDPPLQTDKWELSLKVKRVLLSYDPMSAWMMVGTVNESSFLDFPKGCVLLTNWSGERTLVGTVWYWTVSYEFRIRYDGWQLRVLDEGLRELGGTEDEASPRRLDGTGKFYPETPITTCHFIDFVVIDSSNFDILNISKSDVGM